MPEAARHGGRTVVIGAGITGASIAWHLARLGLPVTIVDGRPGPAMGVTGHAFGWINLVVASLQPPAFHALQQDAVADYERLARDLPQALQDSRRGSLVWRDDAAQTEALANAHLAVGNAIKLIDGKAVRRLEPHLRTPPPLAVHSAGDIALDPARLSQTLLDAAIAHGAVTRFSQAVTGIDTVGGRVSGIRTADGMIEAETLVIAAGVDAGALVAPLGIDLAVRESPVLLLRYEAERRFINGIVCGPELEIRQAQDGSLVVADDFTGEDPQAVGLRTLDTIKAAFDVPGGVSLRSAAVGVRPIPEGSFPVAGFADGIDGLYLAVAHPGVILAPLLGRRAADAISARLRA